VRAPDQVLRSDSEPPTGPEMISQRGTRSPSFTLRFTKESRSAVTFAIRGAQVRLWYCSL
jgi:hypothetical protein